jgi:hypothetical protein
VVLLQVIQHRGPPLLSCSSTLPSLLVEMGRALVSSCVHVPSLYLRRVPLLSNSHAAVGPEVVEDAVTALGDGLDVGVFLHERLGLTRCASG